MLNWYWRTFQTLQPHELYEIAALRQTVFIVEQKCIYSDLDYQDQTAMHLLGMQDTKLVAYLRLLLKNSHHLDAISFGRVTVATPVRNQGLGKQLVQQVLTYLSINGNTKPIIIGAQLYLKEFYEAFDFVTMGQPYDEDGIPHIKMVRQC